MRFLIAAVFLFTVTAPAQTKLPAAQNPEAWLERGVSAYRQANYEKAAEAFSKAADIEPSETTPRLYLAMTYMARYVPGLMSKENLEFASHAEVEFLKVLEMEPENETAIRSIANLAFYRAMGMTGNDRWEQLDRAKEWNQRLIDVNPNNKIGFYTQGLIAWAKCNHQRPSEAAASRAKCVPVIDDGIAQLSRAVKLDSDYDEAMSYLNLLYELRAGLDVTAAERDRDIKLADSWSGKAAQARKRNAVKPPVEDN